MRAQPLEIVLHFQLENCCCCTLCCVFLYCFSPTPCLPFTLLLLLLIFWLCSFSKPPFLSFGPNNWVWVGRTTTTKTITTTTRAAIWRGNCIVTHCFCLYLSLHTCVCVSVFHFSCVCVCVFVFCINAWDWLFCVRRRCAVAWTFRGVVSKLFQLFSLTCPVSCTALALFPSRTVSVLTL